MLSATLELTLGDHKLAHELVSKRMLAKQPKSIFARICFGVIVLFYTGAMFILTTAPNHLDAHTARLMRGSAIAVFVIPLLLLLIVALDHRRRVALASAALPSPPSTVQVAASEEGLFLITPGIKTEYQWSSVSLAVRDESFAALALTRSAPMPLPARAFSSPEEYFAFLRAVQKFCVRSAA